VKHGKLYRLLALGADAYSGLFSSEVTRSPRSVSVGRGCPGNRPELLYFFTSYGAGRTSDGNADTLRMRDSCFSSPRGVL